MDKSLEQLSVISTALQQTGIWSNLQCLAIAHAAEFVYINRPEGYLTHAGNDLCKALQSAFNPSIGDNTP